MSPQVEKNPVTTDERLKTLRTKAYVNFGREFLRSGRYTQALSAFEEAIENDPLDIRARTGKSLALTRLGKYDDALAAAGDIFGIEVDSPHAYNAQAVCYHAMGLLAEARTAFERSVEIGPDIPVNLYNFACYWASLGDKGRCREYLSRAIGLDPQLNVLAATDVDFKPFRTEDWFLDLVAFKQ
jgi:tetratricopeptide (TPR) repeat protein